VVGFCLVLGAFDTVPALQRLSLALFGNPIVAIVTLLGGSWVAHALAEKHPLNVVAYAAYVLIFGLAIAPIVAYANAIGQPGLPGQAGLITGIVFLGLTI